MEIYKFQDVVDVVKFAGCNTCETYTYTLPCPLGEDIEDFLLPIGKPKYPIKNCKMIRIENEFVRIVSRVGRTWLEVKFNITPDKFKPLFDIQIAAYVEHTQNIKIEF